MRIPIVAAVFACGLAAAAAQDAEIDLATGPAEPTLVITLSPAPGRLDSGHERWIPQNQVERLTNTDKGPIELLRFDFKTPPIRSATP
jgi:hypothetical protein